MPPSSVRSHQPLAGGELVLAMRCPLCGRRVPAVCPTHGKLELPEPDSSQVSGSTNPHFAGYRVERVVARGGFGTVFAAQPEGGGETVAIKLPRPDRPDARLCLLHEVRVLREVGTPHVPGVLGSGALGDGTPYVVMQYLTGPTLAEQLLDRAGPLPLDEAVSLARATLAALGAVHDKGYIHRDLKPENVFVDEADGRVTLVDFGLTAPMDPRARGGDSTLGGPGVGTAEYMSPEQCEGRADIDARADLYAMGVMLFELCAGHPPFWGPRSVVCESHLSRRPPRLSASIQGLPSGAEPSGPVLRGALDEVVARCLAKDRADRYPSVAALREALAAVLAPSHSTHPTQPAPARVTMRSPPFEPQAEGVARLGAERPPVPVVEPAVTAPTEPSREPARAGGDRVSVGLLFFSTDVDVVALQAEIVPLGGQIAYAAEGRCVAVFGQEAGDNPARRALRAAEDLLRRGVSTRIRLDLAPVVVRTRRDGAKRFMSALFTQADRFPPASGPEGLSLAPAAAAVLPDVATPEAAAQARSSRSRADNDPTAEMAGWPLVGREAIIDALVEGARRVARESAPAAAMVIGEPGQGKSHLFRVLVKRLGETGAGEVLALRAREPALGDVDHTLATLLQRALDLPAGPPPDGGRELLRERLGGGRDSLTPSVEPPPRSPGLVRSGTTLAPPPPSVPTIPDGPRPRTRPPPSITPASISRPTGAALGPAVALALGWIAPDAPDSAMRPELRALRAAPGALRSALTVAAGEALRRRAANRPLFVVLDDAHFASDVVLSALEYAALAEGGAPLWICALGRPALEQQAPSWGERAGRRELFRVGPLDAESAATLCRMLLLPVESVAGSAVQRLVERTQAIPLLLVELVRGLRREGIVRKSPKGEAWYLATDELDRLPDLPLIEWLAQSELDTLAPTLRGHLRLLALLGEQVTLADVEGVLRLLEQEGGDLAFPLDGRVATQRLLATGVVIEDRDGRIGFRHALVREAIARGTPEALRRRIHRAAARHYQGASSAAMREPAGYPAAQGRDEHRAAQLAYHAAEAGMGPVAGRVYLELAEQARARHAYTDAERLYSRALEQPGGAGQAERAAGYRGRGLMRSRIGRYHDALADFSCARTMADEQGDGAARIEILLDEGTAFDWLNEFKNSEERVEEARARMCAGSTSYLSARLLLGLGRSAHRFSRNEEAADLLARAAAEAELLGDDGYETRIIALVMLGFICQGLSRLEDARQALDQTIALCESHGDRVHLGAAISNRALLWSYLGDKERMAADSERALSLAREFAQTTLEFIGEFNLGETLLMLDDDAAAEPHVRRAIELDRRLSGAEVRHVTALLEAKLHLYRGEEAEVRAILAKIRRREAEAQAQGEADALLVPTEEVAWSMLDLATRGAEDGAWDELERRAQRYSQGYEQIEVVETRAVWTARQGRAADARRHLERAHEMCSRVPNPLAARLERRLRELG